MGMSEIKGKGNAGVTDRSLDFAYYGTDEVTNNRFVYLAGIGSAGSSRPDLTTSSASRQAQIICLAWGASSVPSTEVQQPTCQTWVILICSSRPSSSPTAMASTRCVVQRRKDPSFAAAS